VETLADHLRDRQLLLVLDNSERVVAAGVAVARLLDSAPRFTVLATSRIPLHISGEREYQVPPLSVPDPGQVSDADQILRSEAVTLFAERAATRRPGFRIGAENVLAVAEIAARLDGLPLAIELAASRLNVLTPDDLLARLGQRLSLLSGGARDLPERQRTLRGTIEWSHDLLEPAERRLFARLSAFSGGWTLPAAEDVCGPELDLPVLDGLTSLVDHSLVRRMETAEGEARFAMLDTIREFSTERLAESGEEKDIRRRHAEHVRGLAEEAEHHFTREHRIEWLARLEAEHDNVRAALDWAQGTGDAGTGLRTAAAIWRFWLQRGHLVEGRRRLEGLLSTPGAATRSPIRARALGALGGIAYWQNDYPTMSAAYEEAVDIAREIGDPNLLAAALLDLSFIPYVEQDPDRAEAILREGMATAEGAGDRVLVAEFWSSIGFLEVVRGNPAESIEIRRTAVEVFREEGEVWILADQLSGLGLTKRLVGDLEGARGHYREALEIFAQANDTLSISMPIWGLSFIANDEGEHERAARLLGASARIRDDIGGGVPPELGGRWGDPEGDARRALGEAAYQRARAEGYAMTTEEAIAYAREDIEQ
jgi:predicted ATPase